MSLNGKCHAGDICVVLDKKTSASGYTFEIGGGYRPCYYEANQTLILSPATDKEDPFLKSITEVIAHAGQMIKEAADQDKAIIIPVAEQQIVFGIPRNHWVTLHFAPKSKICTLIDSRPRFFSLLYPTSMMVSMLENGLKASGVDTEGMVFNQIHQGVQFNDIFCGSWTLMNILALAGVLGGETPFKSIEELKTAFSTNDEADIVNKIIDFSGTDTQKLAPLTGSIQRLLVSVRLLSYSAAVKRPPEENSDGFVSSNVMMNSILGGNINPAEDKTHAVAAQSSSKEPVEQALSQYNVSASSTSIAFS